MIKFDQWWFPDHEKHLQGWMTAKNQVVEGRLTYQYHKYAASLKYASQRRTAIDCGAHVGLFSYWMCRDFAMVHCFEPVSEHRDCFQRNMLTVQNYTLHPIALGAENASHVGIVIPEGSSGGTHLDLSVSGTVMVRRFDDLRIDGEIDFVKVDCEGFELFALQGAVEMLKRCRPCVIVEQKQHIMAKNFGTKGTPAVAFLESLGAVRRCEISGDYVLSWPA